MATKPKNELSLDSILAPTEISETPDQKTELELKSLGSEELKARVAKLNQDIKLRKKYSGKLYFLVSIWLAAIFLLLLLQGFVGVHGYFALSDKVLITIIGGTTINVLGLFAIVANYIFPKESSRTRIIKKK